MSVLRRAADGLHRNAAAGGLRWHALCLLAACALAQALPAVPQTLTVHETQDLGVPAQRGLHPGPMHGPTPTSLPGGRLVTTEALAALLGRPGSAALPVDVLGQGPTLPGAVAAPWLGQPGALDDALQPQAAAWLARLTGGVHDRPLVFFCASRECWLSYNAARRAVHAGHTQVMWYRGGLQAWQAAGLPLYPPPDHAAAQAAGAQPPPRAQARAMQAASAQSAPLPAASLRDLPSDPRFTIVEPHRAPPRASPAPPAESLRIARGRAFSYALPPGWRVGEDGTHALTLVAPDALALTVMVGNAGMPPGYPPARYAHERMLALQPGQLQIGAPRAARPAPGFTQAVAFDLAFTLRGVAWRGTATVSAAPAYDSATMAMTAALAEAGQWPGYARWLPEVAASVAAVDGAAFGMRGLMQQNLQNSAALAQAAREHREWSARTWGQVAADRHASDTRRQHANRELLGNVQSHANPFDGGRAVDLPTSHRHYWVDRQGRVLGTDDAGADPNHGSTGEWRRMPRVQP